MKNSSSAVNKWMPVLRKCEDIPVEQRQGFAQLLENQFDAWVPENNLDNIADFAKFALPVSRRVWTLLTEEEFSINVVLTDEPGMQDFPVATVSDQELETIAMNSSLGMDIVADTVDFLSKKIVEGFKSVFPKREIDLFLLMQVSKSVPSPLDFYPTRAVICRARPVR